jgi:hypothetical protein
MRKVLWVVEFKCDFMKDWERDALYHTESKCLVECTYETREEARRYIKFSEGNGLKFRVRKVQYE